jgi:hypothetical protein
VQPMRRTLPTQLPGITVRMATSHSAMILRVGVAGRDPQPEHVPPRLTDAPVAEVLTKQIGVRDLVNLGGEIARTIAAPPLRAAAIAHR